MERLVDDLMDVEMRTKRKMKNLLVIKISRKINHIIPMIKIMEIKEEEEENIDQEEEDFVEHVSNVEKKDIDPISFPNIKEGLTEDMRLMHVLSMSMNMLCLHVLKM